MKGDKIVDQNRYREYFLERKIRMLTALKDHLSDVEINLNNEIEKADPEGKAKMEAVFMASQEVRREIKESYDKAITELYDLREKLAPPLPDNPFLFRAD